MFHVQFYSIFANEYVTISKHRTLDKAIERARKAYTDDGYTDVSILSNNVRFDRYGKIL